MNVCSLVNFLLSIVMLQFKASGYPFGIFYLVVHAYMSVGVNVCYFVCIIHNIVYLISFKKYRRLLMKCHPITTFFTRYPCYTLL